MRNALLHMVLEVMQVKHYEVICVTCDRCNKETVDCVELNLNDERHQEKQFDLCAGCWGSFRNPFIGGLRVDAINPKAWSEE